MYRWKKLTVEEYQKEVNYIVSQYGKLTKRELMEAAGRSWAYIKKRLVDRGVYVKGRKALK